MSFSRCSFSASLGRKKEQKETIEPFLDEFLLEILELWSLFNDRENMTLTSLDLRHKYITINLALYSSAQFYATQIPQCSNQCKEEKQKSMTGTWHVTSWTIKQDKTWNSNAHDLYCCNSSQAGKTSIYLFAYLFIVLVGGMLVNYSWWSADLSSLWNLYCYPSCWARKFMTAC